MDDPNNLMIITGILSFDAPIDIERLKATMEHSMLKYRRFRQRIVESRLPWRCPYWEDDPAFDIDEHIQKVSLPHPGDQSVLHDVISELMSHELEYNHPLWRFYIIEKFKNGSVLICRLHHAIADGISLMQVLLSMADNTPDAPWPTYQPESGTAHSSEKWFSRIKKQGRVYRAIKNSTNKLLHGDSRSPSFASGPGGLPRLVINTTLTAGRVILRRPDPKTLFKGSLNIKKRAAWSKPIPLLDIKQIGKTFGATINDVLLTLVTGALRQYIQSKSESLHSTNIRGFIPVNLRPIEIDENLGNRFGLVFVTLPISTPDPLTRLSQIKQNMDELKSSTEPVVTLGIIHLMGALPTRLQDVAIDIFDTKGTAIITNVPGPKEQLFLAGSPINMLMAWVPQSGRIGLGISIISYNGNVWLGLATDQGLVPDPEKIIDYFYDEFDGLNSLAMAAQTDHRTHLNPTLVELDHALQALDELLGTSELDNGSHPSANLER
jgi:WS/DGAT/MGAT family acyltransferase